MREFKFLIDTNIVIGLEDNHKVNDKLTDLIRRCSTYGVRLFIDSATLDDIERDPHESRRAVTLSKVKRFESLTGVTYPVDTDLSKKYGAINSDNDRSDARLLFCVERGAVDFLVTEDVDLHKRAHRAGFSDRILFVEDALTWLAQSFEPKIVKLPHIVERKAYAIDKANPIFNSLREDYPGFDIWFDRCAREHRKCWVVEVGNDLAGLVVRKNESRIEAGVTLPGNKILKICTFKMAERYRGEHFGEHLLKQILWFAERNKYDVVYLTVFPNKETLINLLQHFGFSDLPLRFSSRWI